MKKKIVVVMLYSALSIPALAQESMVGSQGSCPIGAVECSIGDYQFQGDISNAVNNGDTRSSASQLGNSSASNASGNDFSPEFNNKDQNTNHVANTNGSDHAQATGGASSATGNRSDTSVQTGANTSGSNSSSNGTNELSHSGNSESTAVQTQGMKNSGNHQTEVGNTSSVAADQKSNSSSTGYSGSQSSSNLKDSGNAKSTSKSGDSAAKNDTNLTVDASDRSSSYTSYVDRSRTVFIPAIIPPTPPSTIAVGNIIKETTACGPLQAVEKTPINGKFFGVMFESDVEQGFTYDLVPWYDDDGSVVHYLEIPLENGRGYRLIGHQAVIFATVVGTANSRNVAIGGGSSGGSWGQGGTGTSAANQQLVTNIQLRHCEYGFIEYQAPEVPVIEKKIKG